MIYVYRICSPALSSGLPASLLDGHEWTYEARSREDADARALANMVTVFSAATPDRRAATSLSCVAEYPSREAMRRAEEAA